MIYPNFIDTDDADELTYFRSIFPLNFYDTYLGENNDNSEIPNLYTLVDNICKLFPDDTNKTQLVIPVFAFILTVIELKPPKPV